MSNRAKYETLALSVLKDLAKARGIKGITGLKKADVIEAMLKKDEEDAAAAASKPEEEPAAAPVPAKQHDNAASGKPAQEQSAKHNEKRAEPEGEEDEKDRPGDLDISDEKRSLDSGIEASGILEVLSDGYGFIRSENYLPGENDVYVAPSQIRRFSLKTGDIITGNTRVRTQSDKFGALLFVKTINGLTPADHAKRKNFEDLTPIFPNERIRLERPGGTVAMRIMDLMSPVGKGQRGMIVSPPKAGKTTLLKDVARSVTMNNPEMHLIILLIDERPEEVTDIKEAIEGDNVEVIYSTFDELPEHHKRVSEMVIERAKRLVECGKDVIILLDSITRLTRAYNMTVPPSGRTLSGGLDPAALHMPKRFFGAARNMREGGSLTILATALIETGSKMDDVVYEEFKGTGNMEMILDRKLSERRVFPAIDIPKSGTRREDLLLEPDELEAINIIRKALNGLKAEEAVEKVLDMFVRTRSNHDFVQIIKKTRFI
ncbi:MAG: transcription termination factor Rho [Lachnospiraceae bacterium]|nr:transcription termination factor Rho [Lachnospiraceae bacterium]